MGWGLLLMFLGMAMLDSEGIIYGIAVALTIIGIIITFICGERRGWK